MIATDRKIFTIDIGGSNIKGTILNAEGDFMETYQRLPTPAPASPSKVLNVIHLLSQKFQGFTHISAGFPGYVKNGVVKTAPNLGTAEWHDFNLQQELSSLLGRPALVVNDADLQGLSISSGKGLELMVTLGTGFGSALIYNGTLLPHLEIAHHPITKKKDYDAYIGEAELKRIGKAIWNERMVRVLGILKTVFNYDTLYISGGNADKIEFELESNIVIVGNRDGIKGGARLWMGHDAA